MNNGQKQYIPAKYLSNYPTDLSETIFRSVDEGIMITDQNKRIVHVNPAFELVTGYKRIEVVGHSPRILQSGVHDRNFYNKMWDILDNEGKWEGEIWNCRKNGEIFPEWLKIMAIRDDEGNLTNYCGVFTDLSNKEGALKHLKDAALTDYLTKLSNRQSYMERMEELLNSKVGSENEHAVIFLDLNRFKQINDTFGHKIGDEMLIEFGKLLRLTVKNKDIVARYGGDEFLITLTKIKHLRDVVDFVEKLLKLLEVPYNISGHELFMSTSIGISIYPHDGKTIEKLIHRADSAMYESKKSSRNSYTFYYDELEQDMIRTISLETELLKTIEQKSFSIHYQPKINLIDDEVDSFEALLSLESKELGLIDAGELIPLANELGLVVEMTDIVLEQVCTDLRGLKVGGIEQGRIAINIPKSYFTREKFVSSIMSILENYNISPRLFELEITEATMMDNEELAIRKLTKLKKLGFTLTVANFGSGYSSLSYLPKFPFDFIKIDKAFIGDIFNIEENKAIVDTIIYLAHRLGISVIAEGVNNEQEAILLKSMGCDFIQGVYVSEFITVDMLGNYFERMDIT